MFDFPIIDRTGAVGAVIRTAPRCRRCDELLDDGDGPRLCSGCQAQQVVAVAHLHADYHLLQAQRMRASADAIAALPGADLTTMARRAQLTSGVYDCARQHELAARRLVGGGA